MGQCSSIYQEQDHNFLLHSHKPQAPARLAVPSRCTYTYFNNDWVLSDSTSKVKIYFDNGNILKREKFNSQGSLTSTYNYEYDTKPSIYKNITGFDKLYFTDSFENVFNRHFDIKDISNSNNITFSSEKINGIFTEANRYSYDLNTDGYPKEKRYHYNRSNEILYLIEKNYTYY